MISRSLYIFSFPNSLSKRDFLQPLYNGKWKNSKTIGKNVVVLNLVAFYQKYCFKFDFFQKLF